MTGEASDRWKIDARRDGKNREGLIPREAQQGVWWEPWGPSHVLAKDHCLRGQEAWRLVPASL